LINHILEAHHGEGGDVTDSPSNSVSEGKQEPGSVQSSDSEFY